MLPNTTQRLLFSYLLPWHEVKSTIISSSNCCCSSKIHVFVIILFSLSSCKSLRIVIFKGWFVKKRLRTRLFSVLSLSLSLSVWEFFTELMEAFYLPFIHSSFLQVVCVPVSLAPCRCSCLSAWSFCSLLYSLISAFCSSSVRRRQSQWHLQSFTIERQTSRQHRWLTHLKEEDERWPKHKHSSTRAEQLLAGGGTREIIQTFIIIESKKRGRNNRH